MKEIIVAQFNYKDKDYVFYIKNNKINFGYIDNNVIKNDLTDSEKAMMTEALPKIIPNKSSNIYKVGETKYNKKVFQIFLDKVSGIKLFYQIRNNEYLFPDYEDLVYLNCKFNHQMILKEENKKIRKPMRKKYTKYITIAGVIVSVTCVASIINLASSLNDYNYTNDYIVEYNITTPCYYEDIESLINNNVNLSQEEKNLLLCNPNFFTENKEFIDMSNMTKVLNDLSIDYDRDNQLNYNIPFNASGAYFPDKHDIVIFSNSFKEASKDTILHEFCHCFSNSFSSLGHGLKEAVTETMQNEYFGDFCSVRESYDLEKDALKALCEIVGVDVFRQFHFSGHIKFVIDALKETINDEEKAIELISAIDDITIYSNEINEIKQNENYYRATIEETQENLTNNNKKIYGLIKEYFEEKYDYPMEEDENMMVYLGDNFTDTKVDLTDYGFSSVDKVTINKDKGYFSKEYIEKHPYNTFCYEELTDPIYVNSTIEEALQDGYITKEDNILKPVNGVSIKEDENKAIGVYIPSKKVYVDILNNKRNNTEARSH